MTKKDMKSALVAGLCLLASLIYGQDCKGWIQRRTDAGTQRTFVQTSQLLKVAYIRAGTAENQVYYLELKTFKPTLTPNPKGVYLIFNNQVKINLPDEKIDVSRNEIPEVYPGRYVYNVNIPIDYKTMQMLSKSGLGLYRLGSHVELLEDNEVKENKRLATCLLRAQ